MKSMRSINVVSKKATRYHRIRSMTNVVNGVRARALTVALFLACLSASVFAAGDGAPARLSGKVVDPNGAAIQGAKVTAKLINSTKVHEVVTAVDGTFELQLTRGEYTLSATFDGFERFTTLMDLGPGDREIGELTLNISAAVAKVTVGQTIDYLADVSRTATKTFTQLRDIPQSISVVKREQMVDQQMSSIADIVRFVPGVSSHQGENNRDDVILRGNRSSADFYRNGVRDDFQYYRDLYNLDRVEVIKGANAMAFGRGGGGGVINRVVKEARFGPIREVSLTAGSYQNGRFTGDIGDALTRTTAYRINGVFENGRSFRKYVNLNRAGIAPAFAWAPDGKTSINIGYEYFRDRRTADRGVTSFRGRPVDLPISTFYGDTKNSTVRADVQFISGSIERIFGNLIFRNHLSYGDYDRFYQNYVPGSVNAARTLVSLTAYNNATRRRNLFDQTDLIYTYRTGRLKHTIAGGTEFGRQATDNLRNTGYFNNITTSIQVAFADPRTSTPVTWRQSATDANNHLLLGLAAAYVQDQIDVNKYVQAIVGVRYDYFDLKYLNKRTNETLERADRLISPRLGLIVKPVETVSLYAGYTVSQLPSSGDQFSSLTSITQQVKPEKFQNYEAGLKWDVRRGLLLTSAIYRLDRTNTRSTDPFDPTRIVQTGSQRTNGIEIGLTGDVRSGWAISGGYAYQDARITSSTTVAPVGRRVAQVPKNSFSLWNKYQFTRRFAAGLGLIYRSEMFAAIDNTVILPGYLKADAAAYYKVNEHWRLQVNVENITNRRYFVNADSNTNISPGSPLRIKAGLIVKF